MEYWQIVEFWQGMFWGIVVSAVVCYIIMMVYQLGKMEAKQ